MMKQHRLSALLIFFLLVTAAGQEATKAIPSQLNDTRVETVDGAYTNISAKKLHLLLAKKTFPLINVHVPYEGEIEGTDVLIPYNEIDKIVSVLPSDKNVRVVLYCRSGRMSGETSTALVKLGYTNVWNLERGMIEWKEAHFPLVIRKNR